MKQYLSIIAGLIVISLLGILPANTIAQEDTTSGISHGPLTGEVSADSATLWARGSEAGTITFDVFVGDNHTEVLLSVSVDVNNSTDFTGEVVVDGLTPNTAYTYTVSHDAGEETRNGAFKTAPSTDDTTGIDFVFGSCLGGQGYCRNPETGWAIFDTMLAESPDFW